MRRAMSAWTHPRRERLTASPTSQACGSAPTVVHREEGGGADARARVAVPRAAVPRDKNRDAKERLDSRPVEAGTPTRPLVEGEVVCSLNLRPRDFHSIP